jgi:aminoglycoside/choline kinase family phosphotransferase
LVRYPSEVRRQFDRDLETRRFCERHGLRVPALYEVDRDAGWAVLEDLGDHDAAATLAATPAADREGLVSALTRPLCALAAIDPRQLPRWNQPLDSSRLRWELAGFELWFVRHRCGRTPSAQLGRWLDRLATTVGSHPQRVCHRDYHLNNLFVLADGSTAAIDFQDVTLGPDTYDLVSLLGERALPRLLAAEGRLKVARTWAENTAATPGWRERSQWTSVQRGLKVIGTFARLELTGTASYGGWLSERCADIWAELDPIGAPDELIEILRPAS